MNTPFQANATKAELLPNRWIRNHSLFTFFVFTFILTFAGWFLAMITGIGLLFDIGLWGPAFAAILITATTRGKQGMKELIRRLLLWRVPLRWYLAVIFGWPVISILATLLHNLIIGQPVTVSWNQWDGFKAFLISAPILGFWANEEIGWRGFALPHLLVRWNALLSSIVLGTIWWLWHLPYYLGSYGVNTAFYPLLVFTISLTILMTWVFKYTQGSIFVATFFHFWVNIYGAFQSDKLLSPDPAGETMIQYLLLACAAVVVVILYGYRNLAHGRDKNSIVE